SEFEPSGAVRNQLGGEQVTFSYFGSLYSGRSPESYLHAWSNVVSRLPESLRNRIVIQFIGNSGYTEAGHLVTRFGLGEYVDFRPSMDKRAAFEAMKASTVLVSLQGPEYVYAISAKVYDYLMTQRPILAIVPTDGCEAKLLLKFPGTFLADPGNIGQIEEAINNVLSMIWSGKSLIRDPDALEPLTQRALAHRFHSIFLQVKEKSGS
ncbi:MAG: hypothetical protein AB1563_12795, partial [Bacillota bacterium]